MNKIKWTGPKHYPDFGVCLPGQIVTREQVSLEAMEKWVSQGFAEWFNEPLEVPLHAGPEKTVHKKKKIKREA